MFQEDSRWISESSRTRNINDLVIKIVIAYSAIARKTPNWLHLEVPYRLI